MHYVLIILIMDRFRSDIGDTGRTFAEIGRRIKRLYDGQLTRRRILVLFLLLIFFSLYLGPSLLRWLLSYADNSTTSPDLQCLNRYLSRFKTPLAEYDASIINNGYSHEENVPYIGNGYIGLTYHPQSFFNIKFGRTLSLHVEFTPYYGISELFTYEGFITDYRNGIVHACYCSNSGYDVAHRIYTHRSIPSLLVQEIEVNNPTDNVLSLKWIVPFISHWPTAVTQSIKLHHGLEVHSYQVVTGMVDIPKSENVLAVSVVYRKMPDYLKLSNKDNVKLKLWTVIEYSAPIAKIDYAAQKDAVEKRAISSMENIISIVEVKNGNLNDLHVKAWQELWETGFSISNSKAEKALNGDKINATMYAVLSQVRMFEKEELTSLTKKSDILRSLAYPEGCYEGHYTLQADDLWRPLTSLQQVNSVVNSWLLTLEKQGCHNLMHAGASGVVQAMVLSFGSLHFSNQHLELNMHPSDLHRNFLFRRINYGNMTHVNISIIVHEDNKAALYVALDRSDKNYYACDGGCLDAPVQLGPAQTHFPVKLTDPPTAVLYVTSDRQHMEDLRHAIHVKEVILAPAHEHHVIALHKHGHTLGGLPTTFWVSICILIVLFHLFLCRIIMTEYCENSSSYNYKRLYNKP